MSDETQFRAEREGPVPVSEMIAAMGLFYLAILSALIFMAAIVDLDVLIQAMDVLQIGNPAIMAGFTA